jgi:hypothetical protein
MFSSKGSDESLFLFIEPSQKSKMQNSERDKHLESELMREKCEPELADRLSK